MLAISHDVSRSCVPYYKVSKVLYGLIITYWGLNKMYIKVIVFGFKLHWCLVATYKMTSQHWFSWWLGTNQVTIHNYSTWTNVDPDFWCNMESLLVGCNELRSRLGSQLAPSLYINHWWLSARCWWKKIHLYPKIWTLFPFFKKKIKIPPDNDGLNSLWPGQNAHHFENIIFNCILSFWSM